MERPLFSIIVVSLNAGEKLLETIESIRGQSCQKLEVVVKDGGSKDGSIQRLREMQEQGTEEFWKRVRIYEQQDKSIYDGMNQATKLAEGKYFYFLNSGDYFYDGNALCQMADYIESEGDKEKRPHIFYGDIYDALRNSRVASNPRMDGFACYRNVPCHQACIYDRELFAERGYELKFRVRADYEHFLWCFYRGNAVTQYVPVILASYEGGGFSETKENRLKSRQEHKEITAVYMSAGERFRYRLALLLTLAPLRTRMAESPVMSGFYNRCKKLIYNVGKK